MINLCILFSFVTFLDVSLIFSFVQNLNIRKWLKLNQALEHWTLIIKQKKWKEHEVEKYR